MDLPPVKHSRRIGQSAKRLGNRFRVVFPLELLFALCFKFFSFANALRLQKMKSERESHVKPLPAQPATNRELKQSQAGNIGKSHPGCSEFGTATVGAIHGKPVFRRT